MNGFIKATNKQTTKQKRKVLKTFIDKKYPYGALHGIVGILYVLVVAV